jgi:tyrosinase
LADATVDYTGAFKVVQFTAVPGSGFGFGGQLSAPKQFGTPHGAFESAPHDLVHIALGGLMKVPTLAARDPIFFLHHANVDRLWGLWLAQGGGRSDPTTAAWLTQTFTFYDENRNAVVMTPAQVLDTATQLGYDYSPPPTTSAVRSTASAVQPLIATGPPRAWEVLAQSVVLNAQPSPVSASLNQTFGAELARSLATPGIGRVVMRFEGMLFVEGADVHYEIYANLPSGTAPDPRNAFLVGTLSPFGRTMNMPGMGSGESSQDYDLTSALRASAAAQPHHGVGEVTLTFVARTGLVDAAQRPFPIAPGVRARIGNILIYTR